MTKRNRAAPTTAEPRRDALFVAGKDRPPVTGRDPEDAAFGSILPLTATLAHPVDQGIG